MSQSDARAGWYPDPGGSGGQRYWDGTDWTTQCRQSEANHATPWPVWAAGSLAVVAGVVIAQLITHHNNQRPSLPRTAAITPAISSAQTPPIPPPAPAAPAPASAASCGPDQATALHDALNQLAPEPITGRGWQGTPIDANYNPCADLSTILVTIQGGTGSSPTQALMFHRGTYLGTATLKAYGFTSLNASASTEDTVVLSYRSGQTCTACDDGVVTNVRYRWDGAKVQMLDPPPP